MKTSQYIGRAQVNPDKPDHSNLLYTVSWTTHFEDLWTNGNLPCGKVSHVVMDVVGKISVLITF